MIGRGIDLAIGAISEYAHRAGDTKGLEDLEHDLSLLASELEKSDSVGASDLVRLRIMLENLFCVLGILGKTVSHRIAVIERTVGDVSQC